MWTLVTMAEDGKRSGDRSGEAEEMVADPRMDQEDGEEATAERRSDDGREPMAVRGLEHSGDHVTIFASIWTK